MSELFLRQLRCYGSSFNEGSVFNEGSLLNRERERLSN